VIEDFMVTGIALTLQERNRRIYFASGFTDEVTDVFMRL